MRKGPGHLCTPFVRKHYHVAIAAAALSMLTVVTVWHGFIPGLETFQVGDASQLKNDGMATNLELQQAGSRRQCPPREARIPTSIAFLHVPKTAGNFLVKLMKQAMPAHGPGRFCTKREDYSNHANFPCVARTGLAPEHLQLLADLRANFTTRCHGFNVHQDWGFLQALRLDHSRTLTMVALRHPVDRVLSHYYFMLKLRRRRRETFAFWPRNDSDFSGLVAFASQQRQMANYHAYLLAGDMGCAWPGQTAALPLHDGEVLKRAKRNLERFCVILIFEHMTESLRRLADAAGWPEDALIARAGNATNATPRPTVPLSVRRAIEAANHLDMQLYKYALKLFLRHR